MKNKEEVKTEEKKLTNAFIIPQEVGTNIVAALKRVPIEYIQHIGPILQYLEQQVYRGDVTVQVPVNEPKK